MAICSLPWGGVWYGSPLLDFSFNLLGICSILLYCKIKKLRKQSLLPGDKTKWHRVTITLKDNALWSRLAYPCCMSLGFALPQPHILVLKWNYCFCTFSVQSVWNNGELCCNLPEWCFLNMILKEVVHPGIWQYNAVGVWGYHAVRVALKNCVKQRKPNW